MLKNKLGFTVVELVIIIVVIAVLATITVFGFNGWNKQVATSAVQSDLSAATAAMESEKNFSNGYPTSLPSKFENSKDVSAVYVSGDAKSFCIEASSTKFPDITYFVSSATGTSKIIRGTCASGELFDSNYTAFVYDLNLPGCVGTNIQLPVRQPSSASGSVIKWGDSTQNTLTVSNQSHSYASKGTYTVLYDGPISEINTSSTSSDAAPCLQKVSQWSDSVTPTQMRFQNSTNISYVAAPPSSVTNMESAFDRASAFNQPVDSWDVSNVTNMRSMFARATSFNQPLNSWNVSNVTNIAGMFDGATIFNQPIGNWNVSKVTDMSNLFTGALAFNQPLNSWNVSNVTNMSGTFGKAWSAAPGAISFNQPLNNWNTSKVTDMSHMFQAARTFNQNISSWNTSNVTDMSYMFDAGVGDETNVFNQPLNTWNTSKVTKMNSMFGDAKMFNQPIGNWDVSKVTDFGSMFDEAVYFNQPLNTWNTSSATSTWRMFRGTVYNQPLNNWNTSNVVNMYQMFGSNGVYNQNLTGWNVSKVTDETKAGIGGAAAWTQKPPLP